MHEQEWAPVFSKWLSSLRHVLEMNNEASSIREPHVTLQKKNGRMKNVSEI